jgi:hypothetical protein
MIDIRVKYNILLKETIRMLGYTIHEVKNLRMTIASNEVIPFVGLIRIRLELSKGIGY